MNYGHFQNFEKQISRNNFSNPRLHLGFLETQVGSGHPTLKRKMDDDLVEAFRAFRTLRELCWEMMRKGLVSKAWSVGPTKYGDFKGGHILLSQNNDEYTLVI